MATELAADTALSGPCHVVGAIGRGRMGQVYEVQPLLLLPNFRPACPAKKTDAKPARNEELR